VKVHVASLSQQLLESELFGHEKGAFTGATARKLGRVEIAAGGTLFLDEIAEIPLETQVKLLRLLQDREYERVGSARTLSADARFITATHRDLEHLVETGRFREDLFYRINVVPIWVPPLRARRDDIPVLAQHYLRYFRARVAKPALEFDAKAVALLQRQRWPGNVRELINVVERVVVMGKGDRIVEEDIQRQLDERAAFITQSIAEPGAARDTTPDAPALGSAAAAPTLSHVSAVVSLREEVRRAEHRALVKALHSAKGNRALAARMLGISRRTLYTKLEEHSLS
jgi:two-component system response regulator AtoC